MPTRPRSTVGRAAACLIILIAIYQRTLAYLLGGRCRFFPSCSVYAQQALRQHGAWAGSQLTVTRLLRCHPWHPGGVDPVPTTASRWPRLSKRQAEF